MKRSLVLSTFLLAGLAFMASLVALANGSSLYTIIQEEKVKIQPDDLPVPVKLTITKDPTVAALPIAEAYKVPQTDGTAYYEVTFESGSEQKITKKYDKDGNELE